MEKKIEFKTHLSEKEYIEFNFYATYTTKTMIYLVILGIFLCFSLLFALFTSSIKFETNTFIVLFIVLGVIVYVPLILYRSAKKTYHSKGARFTEKMNYSINSSLINFKGESFESKMNWDKILKVKETKKWFLIYETKLSAHIINKRFLSEDKKNDLRVLFEAIPNVKTNLKYTHKE